MTGPGSYYSRLHHVVSSSSGAGTMMGSMVAIAGTEAGEPGDKYYGSYARTRPNDTISPPSGSDTRFSSSRTLSLETVT